MNSRDFLNRKAELNTPTKPPTPCPSCINGDVLSDDGKYTVCCRECAGSGFINKPPTPRTDADSWTVHVYGESGTGSRVEVCKSSTARQLETELAETKTSFLNVQQTYEAAHAINVQLRAEIAEANEKLLTLEGFLSGNLSDSQTVWSGYKETNTLRTRLEESQNENQALKKDLVRCGEIIISHSNDNYDLGLRINKTDKRLESLEKIAEELEKCVSQLGWTSSQDTRWIAKSEHACKDYTQYKQENQKV